MASGNDARFCVSNEVTYGTRVAPTRFFEIVSEGINHQFQWYVSRGLGGGRWRRKRVLTTDAGAGPITMEVPTVGFGFWLNLLHSNTVTPVQQAATPAYLQTHTLNSPVSRSVSIQKQVPPVTSTTLVPVEHWGVMVPSMAFSWESGGVLMAELAADAREVNTAQTLVSYVAPATSGLFSFKGGTLSIGGSSVADIIGGGSVNVAVPIRDDAYPLGSSGKKSKPVETDVPTASGTFTADFNDLTHFTRTTAQTVADVVLLFEGVTISGAHKETFQLTVPDCTFDTPAPSVGGPGPVQQQVTFSNASATGDPVEIQYKATDLTL